jgi:hypothetical protein
MARLSWALFCEHHLTDQRGKNSYIGVFDTATVTLHVSPGTTLQVPLRSPAPSCAFVLAAHITGAPGAPMAELHVKDSDGQAILPTFRSQLANSEMGQHNLHVNFPKGIPVRRSGIYSFEFVVDGQEVGVAELPVDIRVREEEES